MIELANTADKKVFKSFLAAVHQTSTFPLIFLFLNQEKRINNGCLLSQQDLYLYLNITFIGLIYL